jgi:uncharacterized protein YqfA (UPF0365 family)
MTLRRAEPGEAARAEHALNIAARRVDISANARRCDACDLASSGRPMYETDET